MDRFNRLFRRIINKKKNKKLKNTDFSLISSNCNGAFILHDLGMRFNSPFVNLYMLPDDYIKLLSNLKYYMSIDLVEYFEEGIDFPIGLIDDVRIYFMHYSTFYEAKNKWDERKHRINYDNLFVLFCDRDGCTYNNLIEFENLPLENKIVFTHKPYLDIESSFYIHGFESQKEVGNCFEYMPGKIGKKYYDQFDYVNWFNHNII